MVVSDLGLDSLSLRQLGRLRVEREGWFVLPGVWRALGPFFTVGCVEGVLSTLDPASGDIVMITDDCRSELGFFGHSSRNHGFIYSVREFLHV